MTNPRGPDWRIRDLLDAHAENERFAPEVFAAVRAVLDLHKPETQLVWPDPGEPKDAPMLERLYCVECSPHAGAVDYPCDTVQAIANALEWKP